jgi:chemotaxis protein histidine kinase CheA
VASWEEIYADIRAQYVAQSVERLADVERNLDGLEADPSDAHRLAAVRVQFHKLSGSGGTYGFPSITSLSLSGERRCRKLIDTGANPSAEDVAAWREILASLRAEFGGATN